MKLTTNRKNTGVDYDTFYDLLPHEYILLSAHGTGALCGIVFKCPDCGEPLAVSTEREPGEPAWSIDFTTLTATPSILHSRDGKGCGWHGYLTNGELKPC